MVAKQILIPTPNGATMTSRASDSEFSLFDYVLIAVLFGLIAVSIYYIFSTRRSVTRIENFADEGSKGSAFLEHKVVYIKMSHCPYCKKFDPVYKAVSEDKKWQKKNGLSIAFEEPIDVKDNSEKATGYKEAAHCDGYPCYMLINAADGSVVRKETGYVDEEGFKQFLQR
jgi:hypothetical protein